MLRIRHVIVNSTKGGPSSSFAAKGAHATHSAASSQNFGRTANKTYSNRSGRQSRCCRNIARLRCKGPASAGSWNVTGSSGSVPGVCAVAFRSGKECAGLGSTTARTAPTHRTVRKARALLFKACCHHKLLKKYASRDLLHACAGSRRTQNEQHCLFLPGESVNKKFLCLPSTFLACLPTSSPSCRTRPCLSSCTRSIEECNTSAACLRSSLTCQHSTLDGLCGAQTLYRSRFNLVNAASPCFLIR